MVGLGAHWVPGTHLWLVGTPLPYQCSTVIFGQICGLCLSPHMWLSLGRCDLGVGYGLGLSVYCLEALLPQSVA